MSMNRSIRACFAAVALSGCVGAGCYRLHVVDDEAVDGGDGGPSRVDAGGRDGGARHDAGPDAHAMPGEDAGFDAPDAGHDAGVPDAGFDAGTDEPPPIPLPPDPSACRTVPDIEPFHDPVLEYRWPTGPVARGESLHVCSTPLVIDLDPSDGNRHPSLVFVSYPMLRFEDEPGTLRIVDPATNTTISYPADAAEPGVLEPTTNLAAGDVDGDGRPDIIGLGVYSGTYAFRADGTLLWESPYPTVFDRGQHESRSIAGAITLADLEGDGTVEVVAGHVVLNGRDGSLKWKGPTDGGRGTNILLGPIACVADLDGDGQQEVIGGNTAYHADGSVYWRQTFPDGFCAVADLTAERAGPEIAIVSNGYLRLLDGHTGNVYWSTPLLGRVRDAIGGAPTVADFDGDGNVEFGVAHGAAYAVYDPDCTTDTTPGCAGEHIRWQATTADDSSSGTGSSVFDFNGDNRAEVIYNDQYYFRVYDGVTGTALFEWRNSSRTRTENPVIADVDNDGDAEIVFSANAEAFFIREGFTDPGVEVWGDARGRWVGARRIWNQHAYHITNVNEDGTIPAHETPSWTVLDAYRQNLREGSDVLVTPDLWGGRGTYECTARNQARLHVLVQNWGLERVGANVVVGFYRGRPGAGGERIGEALTPRGLEPGGDGVEVTFDVSLTGTVADYYAKLDDPRMPPEGAVGECREDNNVVLIWHPSCPGAVR